MTTLTIQPSSNADTKCTYISKSDPNASQYADTNLTLQAYTTALYIKRGLLYFDVSAIPKNARIVSATLTLYLKGVVGAGTFNVIIGNLIQAYTTGATWNKYDGSNVWTTAGGDIYEQIASTSVSVAGSYNWTIPADIISRWLNAQNFGLLIYSDNENQLINDRYFAKSDDATAENRPKLVIEYEDKPTGLYLKDRNIRNNKLNIPLSFP